MESPYSCKALRQDKCLREGGVGLVNEETLGVELGPIFAAVRNELGVELQTSFFMGNDAVGAARQALAEILGEQSNQEQPGGDEDSEDFVEIEKANPSVQEPKNNFSIQKINVNRNEEYSFYFFRSNVFRIAHPSECLQSFGVPSSQAPYLFLQLPKRPGSQAMNLSSE